MLSRCVNRTLIFSVSLFVNNVYLLGEPTMGCRNRNLDLSEKLAFFCLLREIEEEEEEKGKIFCVPKAKSFFLSNSNGSNSNILTNYQA